MVARANSLNLTSPESPSVKRTRANRSISKNAYRGYLQLSAPRYYTPELGRRPSRDPIGEGAFRVVLGDEARKHPITVAGREYRFVRNDPVANVDIKGVSTLSKKQNGKSKGFECDIKSSTKKFCKLCFIGRSHLIAGVCTGCQRLCYQWCIDQFNNDPFNILPINFVELCGADCSARAAVCVASRCKLKFNP